MTDTSPPATAPAPSRGRILRATLVALAVALVLLFTVVLPAEYGIDPLGTGEALGLSGLAQTDASTVPAVIIPTTGSPITPQELPYKVDAIEFFLQPGQYVEYKYELVEGATMVYQWSSNHPVEVDFHTEPEGKPPEASDSFEKAPSTTGGRGSYRAPYAGIHGWYWMNVSAEPVTLTVQAAGFFPRAFMITDSSRDEMEVLDPPPPPTF